MYIRLVFLAALAVGNANAALPPVPLPLVFFRIPSNSMEPALPLDSLVVAERVVEPLNRGEIVVATSPSGIPLALRIAGLPGDRIQLDSGHAIVNGDVIRNEGSLISAQRIGFARYPRWNETYVVPPHSLYLLADNRVDGVDSIEFGALDLATVSGRLVLWSHALEQPGRVQKILMEAFVPISNRLPITIENEWMLKDIEVPKDTLLRVIYGVDSETFRSLEGLGTKLLESELSVDLCKNRFFMVATGFSVEYVIQSEAGSIHISLQQDKCQWLGSDASGKARSPLSLALNLMIRFP